MNPAEQALAFCSALFADEGDHGGLAAQRAVVFTLPRQASRWLPVTDPAAIADAAVTADSTAAAVYLSMAASAAEPRTNDNGHTLRFNAGEVTCVFGVWADLDIAAPGAHKALDLPPDEAAIRRILDAAGLPPTILWSSGHGLQAFWRFDEPYLIETDAERVEVHRLLVAWQRTLKAHAHRLGGWRVDMVHDLARVLRVPGTTNRKIADHPVPARILEITPDRVYTLDQLNERCLDSEYLAALDVMIRPADSGASEVDLHALWRLVNSREYRELNYEPEWVGAVIAELRESDSRRGRRFARMWRQSAQDSLDDHSSADASMARFIADFGGDERDAMELIMCMRLRSKHKVDKVAPDGRARTYLVDTVAKVFDQARKDTEKRAAQVAASEAVLAQQDADMAPRPSAPPPVDPELLAPDSMGRARDLGGAAVARTAAITGGTVPDPELESEEIEAGGPGVEIPAADDKITSDPESEPDVAPNEPVTDTPEPDVADDGHADETVDDPLPDDPPVDELPADELPADEPPSDPPPPDEPPAPPADDDGDGDDEGPEQDGAEQDGAEQDGASDGDERAVPIGPARSTFPPRTEGTAQALRALSAELLSRYKGQIEIWAAEQRGAGPDRKRCLVLRARTAIGYADGTRVHEAHTPLRSDWWPWGTFSKVTGWLAVLEQDFQLQTTPIQQDDFNSRHRNALIRIWRDDTSGGDLKTLARQSLANYLMDHPPVRDWDEAMSMGQPWIMMRGAGWSTTVPFVVCIRWAEFARYVKINHLGVQINPERMAEIAQHIGAVDARTPEQPGRWKRLDRAYFTDREWLRILVRAEQQATAREQRGRGLQLLPGGRVDRPQERGAERGSDRAERRDAR